MSSSEGGVQIVRSASTLRIFQNTTRKLVHFGPSTPDSISLLLHSSLTFVAFLLLLSFFCLSGQGNSMSLKGMWTTLKKKFDESTPLMICLLLNIWLMGFSIISLALYYRYEKDTEVRYADDVIMVDKDTDPATSSDDNASSTKSGGGGLFNGRLEGGKITVVGLPKGTSTLAIGLSGN